MPVDIAGRDNGPACAEEPDAGAYERVSGGRPGFVVLVLTGATCAWLLVVVRQLPGWHSRR